MYLAIKNIPFFLLISAEGKFLCYFHFHYVLNGIWKTHALSCQCNNLLLLLLLFVYVSFCGIR